MPARIFEGVRGWAIDHAEEGNSTAGTVAGKIKNFPVVIMGTDFLDEILPVHRQNGESRNDCAIGSGGNSRHQFSR